MDLNMQFFFWRYNRMKNTHYLVIHSVLFVLFSLVWAVMHQAVWCSSWLLHWCHLCCTCRACPSDAHWVTWPAGRTSSCPTRSSLIFSTNSGRLVRILLSHRGTVSLSSSPIHPQAERESGSAAFKSWMSISSLNYLMPSRRKEIWELRHASTTLGCDL